MTPQEWFELLAAVLYLSGGLRFDASLIISEFDEGVGVPADRLKFTLVQRTPEVQRCEVAASGIKERVVSDRAVVFVGDEDDGKQ